MKKSPQKDEIPLRRWLSSVYTALVQLRSKHESDGMVNGTSAK